MILLQHMMTFTPVHRLLSLNLKKENMREAIYLRSESVVLDDFENPVIKMQILGHKEFDFGVSQI